MGRILQDPLTILFSLPAVLVGLVIHELSHALVADAFGDPTPRQEGRLTFNPLRHLDVVGTLMLVLMGFGWAKPVRINAGRMRDRRWGPFWVTLAGPMSNLLLAFLSMGILIAGVYRFNVAAPWFTNLLEPMVIINLMLFLLNLLPIPPLDGYQLLKLLLPFQNQRKLWPLERYGLFILIGLSIVGVLGTGLSLGMTFFYGLFRSFYTLIL